MSFQNCKIIGVGVSPTDYHKRESAPGDPGYVMSSSSVRSFYACPAKWREPIRAPDGTVTFWEFPGSKSTEWGDLFDCLLLTPDQFNDRFAVVPQEYKIEALVCPVCESESKSRRCKECKTDRVETMVTKQWSAHSSHCQEWKAEQEKAGKTTVSTKDMWNVKQSLARFLRDPLFAMFLEKSQTQVWVKGEWHDKDTGMVVPCQCLIDVVPTNDSEMAKSLGDVKTTVSARIGAWENWAHKAGYEVQAAWNIDMFVAATNREIVQFHFLLSENTAPWEIGRRVMSQELPLSDNDMGDIASGRRQYRRMMAEYCKALKTGKWPGYDDNDVSVQGWTPVNPDPYAEQRRQFAPKFDYDEPEEDAPAAEGGLQDQDDFRM